MRIFIFLLLIHLAVTQVKKTKVVIDDIEEHKEFKKLLRTRNNVLVLYTSGEKAANSVIKTFESAANTVRGEATTVLINCNLNSNSKKLCKKLKVTPEPYELKHYSSGEFNIDYDRALTVKSLVNFMREPLGDKPWDEDENGKDVLHLSNGKALVKLIETEKRPILIMLYTPWCGYCKKLKPEFNAAAKALKPKYVLAAIDMNRPENNWARTKFNVSSFPTIYYAKSGEIIKEFDQERSREGIIAFMEDPLADHKKKLEKNDWENDPASEIVHLSAENFETSLRDEKSALVMFHTNWCGYCKKMKPEYEAASVIMRQQSIHGILAAVDVDKNQALAKQYMVKGFPTLLYFSRAQLKFKINTRTTEEIISFMKNPVEPPAAPPAEAPWVDNITSIVKHLDEETCKSFLRKRKHALVVFHVPWCEHCKKIRPEFETLARHFEDEPSIGVAAVDCTVRKTVCDLYNIIAYPTIKYFSYSKNERKYKLGRTASELISYLMDPDNAPTKKSEPYGEYPGSEDILMLHEDTFEDALAQNNNLLVLFYAPDCGHCTVFKPIYAEAAAIVKKTKIGVLAAIDGSVYEKVARKYHLAAYPTMKHFRNGQYTGDYGDKRHVDSIFNFMADAAKGRIKEEL